MEKYGAAHNRLRSVFHAPLVRLGTIVSRSAAKAFCRWLFHWKYSGVLIPFCFTVWIALVGVALEWPAGAAHHVFDLAYVFLTLGGLWSLGLWWNSNFLGHKKPRLTPPTNPAKLLRYTAAVRGARRWRWGVSIAIFLPIILFI